MNTFQQYFVWFKRQPGKLIPNELRANHLTGIRNPIKGYIRIWFLKLNCGFEKFEKQEINFVGKVTHPYTRSIGNYY